MVQIMTKRIFIFILAIAVACTKDDERKTPLVTKYEITDFEHPFIIPYQVQRKGTNLSIEATGAFTGEILFNYVTIYDRSADLNPFLNCGPSLVGKGHFDSLNYSITQELPKSKNAYYVIMLIPTTPVKGKIDLRLTEHGYAWF